MSLLHEKWLSLRKCLAFLPVSFAWPLHIPKDQKMGCKSLRDSMIAWAKHSWSFDLLIIAPQNDATGRLITDDKGKTILDELKRLADHKNKTHTAYHSPPAPPTETLIRSLEHIYQVCTGRDEAEKVKRYIALFEENYQSWPMNVMLVGAGDIFPVRFTRWARPYNSLRAYLEGYFGEVPPICSIPKDVSMGSTSLQKSMYTWAASGKPVPPLYVPTDLYYACFRNPETGIFDDWDWNKNGEFGEVPFVSYSQMQQYNPDKVSVIPHVAIGRVLASTVPEVRDYVDKVIHYETISRGDWTKRTIIVIRFDCAEVSQIVKDYLPDFSVKTLSNKEEDPKCPEDPSLPLSESTIRDQLNNVGFGFLIWQGHGGRGGWSNVFALDNVAELTNADMLPVMFAGGSCETARFTAVPPKDPFRAEDGKTYEIEDWLYKLNCPKPACLQTYKVEEFRNMARELTILAKNKSNQANVGAIAYIGCTITGFAEYQDLLKSFLKVAYDNRMNSKYLSLGGIWVRMIEEYYKLHPPKPSTTPVKDSYSKWFLYPWRMCLFGDPSLQVAGLSYHFTR
jgi:hypothetical protein